MLIQPRKTRKKKLSKKSQEWFKRNLQNPVKFAKAEIVVGPKILVCNIYDEGIIYNKGKHKKGN